MIGILLVEIAERLRQLEGVPGHVRRLAGGRPRAPAPNRPWMPPAAPARNPRTASWRARASALSSAAKSGRRLAALLQLAQNVARAHGGVLHVGAGLALEAQRLLQIESDHRIARELQQEIAQRADGDLGGHLRAAAPRGVVGVARRHLFQRLGDQAVHQVVGLHAQALAAGDLHVGPLAVFLGKRNAQLGAAARRQRHHLVGEVHRAVRLLVVAQAAQARHHHVLQIRLPRVDHVVDARAVSELLCRIRTARSVVTHSTRPSA